MALLQPLSAAQQARMDAYSKQLEAEEARAQAAMLAGPWRQRGQLQGADEPAPLAQQQQQLPPSARQSRDSTCGGGGGDQACAAAAGASPAPPAITPSEASTKRLVDAVVAAVCRAVMRLFPDPR